MKHPEAPRLIERQRCAVDHEPIAASKLLGVLMELQHVAVGVIERVAALSLGEIGVFQDVEFSFIARQRAMLFKQMSNLPRATLPFKVGWRHDESGATAMYGVHII